MKICNQNNISFKSRINFVDFNTFDKIKKGLEVEFDTQNHIRKGMEFFTEGIKTCTAGGIVGIDSGFLKNNQKNAAGFHIWHVKDCYNRISEIGERILLNIKEPTNALLIGSKDLSDISTVYSIPIFKRLKTILSNKIENISYFEEHLHLQAQTHLHYSVKNDTFTICTERIPILSEEYDDININNMNDLFDNFRSISIAKSDTLAINGKNVPEQEYRYLNVLS